MTDETVDPGLEAPIDPEDLPEPEQDEATEPFDEPVPEE